MEFQENTKKHHQKGKKKNKSGARHLIRVALYLMRRRNSKSAHAAGLWRRLFGAIHPLKPSDAPVSPPPSEEITEAPQSDLTVSPPPPPDKITETPQADLTVLPTLPQTITEAPQVDVTVLPAPQKTITETPHEDFTVLPPPSEKLTESPGTNVTELPPREEKTTRMPRPEEVFTTPMSPHPSSATSASSRVESFVTSRSPYGSIQNLYELDCYYKEAAAVAAADNESDDDDDDGGGYDGDWGDEMIDGKAEEFIAKFYSQMMTQNQVYVNRHYAKRVK